MFCIFTGVILIEYYVEVSKLRLSIDETFNQPCLTVICMTSIPHISSKPDCSLDSDYFIIKRFQTIIFVSLLFLCFCPALFPHLILNVSICLITKKGIKRMFANSILLRIGGENFMLGRT